MTNDEPPKMVFNATHVQEKPYPNAVCQWCGDKGTFEFYDENDDLQEMECFECQPRA